MSGPYVRKLPTEARAGAKRVTFSWERGTHAVICTSREQAERVLRDHEAAEKARKDHADAMERYRNSRPHWEGDDCPGGHHDSEPGTYPPLERMARLNHSFVEAMVANYDAAKEADSE